MHKPHTIALLAAIARWRRIEAAAREAVDAAHNYHRLPYRVALDNDQAAMRELHRVITEEKP